MFGIPLLPAGKTELIFHQIGEKIRDFFFVLSPLPPGKKEEWMRQKLLLCSFIAFWS